MPEIQAFRGLRYDLGHVGSLTDVDRAAVRRHRPAAAGRALQEAPGQRHPADPQSRRAGRRRRTTTATRGPPQFLKNWRSEGVLFAEPQPALYVYHQMFASGGQTFTRRGFMARVRLERFGEGKIYPHEETMAGPKQDRLLLTRACKANLSQIFGLYPDPEGRGAGPARAGHRRRRAARGHRPPGRRASHVAGERRWRRSRRSPG